MLNPVAVPNTTIAMIVSFRIRVNIFLPLIQIFRMLSIGRLTLTPNEPHPLQILVRSSLCRSWPLPAGKWWRCSACTHVMWCPRR